MNEETKRRLRERFELVLDGIEDSDKAQRQQTITEIEQMILNLRDQVAQAALEEISREIEQRDRERQPAPPPAEPEANEQKTCRGLLSQMPRTSETRPPARQCCPDCLRNGKVVSAWYKGDRARQIITRVGPMRFTRRYYYCRRCDRGFCPLDRQLALPTDTQFTPEVQQDVTLLSACLPFEQAVRTLQRLTGILVSARAAERMCLESAGPLADAFVQERNAQTLPLAFAADPASLPDLCPEMPKPEVLYLAADGIQTPMKGGSWREMKIGVARSEFNDGRVDQESRYVQHLGGSEHFGEHWESLAISCGSLRAKRVVVLGDGASWLWALAAKRFPRAIQILDFWHALEYAGKVAREVFGEGTKAASEWLSARAKEMKKSESKKLFEALSAVRSLAQESVDDALRYFTNNASRMDYARYQRLGLSIGSGMAESSCKRLVTQRLKGSGMHWTEQGASAVCALRCLLLGNEWDAFLQFWGRCAAGNTWTALPFSPLS